MILFSGVLTRMKERFIGESLLFIISYIIEYNLVCMDFKILIFFRRILPNFNKLCSAELMNHKYLVPCDPVQYLDIEYSTGLWRQPEKDNYEWPNLVYYSEYSKDQYKDNVKYYNNNGKFDKESTEIHLLNKNLV